MLDPHWLDYIAGSKILQITHTVTEIEALDCGLFSKDVLILRMPVLRHPVISVHFLVGCFCPRTILDSFLTNIPTFDESATD